MAAKADLYTIIASGTTADGATVTVVDVWDTETSTFLTTTSLYEVAPSVSYILNGVATDATSTSSIHLVEAGRQNFTSSGVYSISMLYASGSFDEVSSLTLYSNSKLYSSVSDASLSYLISAVESDSVWGTLAVGTSDSAYIADISNINILSGSYTAAQVAAMGTNIPEPATTAAVLGLGALGAVAATRSRRGKEMLSKLWGAACGLGKKAKVFLGIGQAQ